MLKKIDFYHCLVVFLCIALPVLITPVALAQIPTQQEITTANIILKSYSQLQAANVSYEKALKTNASKITSGQALKPYLNQLRTAVKTFYMSMYNLKPSQKFTVDHQNLLNASYQNIQVLDGSVEIIDKGGTPDQFVQYVRSHTPQISSKYSGAVKSVLNIVHGWPQQSQNTAMSGVQLLY